jgi:hypothetical protein
MHRALFVPALALLLPTIGAQEAVEAKAPAPAAPAVLTKAFAKAKVHNQRVLAILTEDGNDLAAAWQKDKTLHKPLQYEFELVQFTGKQADTMAVEWKLPAAVHEKPALVVLAADGKVLERLPQKEFFAEGAVDAAKLLGKLKPLCCEPVDAEQELAAGIALAKKTGRAVFVRFDAPW